MATARCRTHARDRTTRTESPPPDAHTASHEPQPQPHTASSVRHPFPLPPIGNGTPVPLGIAIGEKGAWHGAECELRRATAHIAPRACGPHARPQTAGRDVQTPCKGDGATALADHASGAELSGVLLDEGAYPLQQLRLDVVGDSRAAARGDLLGERLDRHLRVALGPDQLHRVLLELITPAAVDQLLTQLRLQPLVLATLLELHLDRILERLVICRHCLVLPAASTG
mmetsp:Transcript_1984/g.3154  ORF Transcript_1984/g.3154 Transcript_1984/m.3154 type:complete len:228 (-) Transcript_1984:46-729(-)